MCAGVKDVFVSVAGAVKISSIRVKLVICTAAFLFIAATVVAACNVTFAYRVVYNNETVGYIAAADQLEEVKSAVVGSVVTDLPQNYLGDAYVSLSLTVGARISASDIVAENILKREAKLIKATVIKTPDGVLCASDASLTAVGEMMFARLNQFITDISDKAEFKSGATAQSCYYPANRTLSIDSVKSIIESLDVTVTKTETYDTEVPFETVTTKSSSYLNGYTKVTMAGTPGVERVTAEVTYLNGTEVSRNELSREKLSEPVAQQVTVGTASIAKISNKRSASGVQFIWPLKRVEKQFISSYYGDGRNHRAIDICSKTGTPIYAAMGGTVTESGWGNGYGYYIIVDHGNGYSTLYAHASKLIASKGAVVSAGDTIALVGSTGDSTGSHLHFEVRINGERVNPIDYLAQ